MRKLGSEVDAFRDMPIWSYGDYYRVGQSVLNLLLYGEPGNCSDAGLGLGDSGSSNL